MHKKIIIGTRGSELALWQANYVLKKLRQIGQHAKIKIIKTKGDLVQNLSWEKIEGKGFFTKEIENALLNKEIDLAVHSHKDLPTEKTKGLVVAAVSEREDPSEILLINKDAVDEAQKFFLKSNAIVGTSSPRRKSQLYAWRSDLQLKDLRGNVPTRIQKLRDKKYDAILIAYAGVARLQIDLKEFHYEKLNPREFIPAPAQGALALQTRRSDKWLLKVLQKINSKEVKETITIERKIMKSFQGGCRIPLGVFCQKEKGTYKVNVAIADRWNSFPKYFYFESKSSKKFSEKVVQRIKSLKPVRVFISRDEKPSDFFKRCLEANGYKVFCKSLIETTPMLLKKFPKTDWIFFTSKNAVKHFFDQQPDLNGEKIGAISHATADEIRKYGKIPEFVGGNNVKVTAKKFSEIVAGKKVLFPQAKKSLRTIQKQLRKEQVVDLPVYETVKKSGDRGQIPKADIFVFTSPSNVEAFFEKNKIPSGKYKRVIAMGKTTAKAIKKLGIKKVYTPPSFDDFGIVQTVFSLS